MGGLDGGDGVGNVGVIVVLRGGGNLDVYCYHGVLLRL